MPETITIGGQPAYLQADAATYLGIDKNTLRFWRDRQTGPAYIKLGKRIFYTVAALDDFIAANSVSA